jgi:pimeloyl-ACP methyl ester carboxylesterase
MNSTLAAAGARLAFLTASDGVRLAVHRLGPESGVPVLLVPGAFSSHTFWLGTRGTGFARALAAEGFEAWVLDPRGHGESQRAGRNHRWEFREWIERDIPAAILGASADGRPAIVAGHSAGGAAVLASLALRPDLHPAVRGVVAIATPAPRLGPFRRLGAAAAVGLSSALGRFPARLLRFGAEDELPGVMAQWMRWNLAGAWRWEGGPDLIAGLSKVRAPALLVAGSGDRVFAPPALCRELLAVLGSPEKTFWDFGKRSGASEDFGHAGLVVSKAASREVWPRLLDWMKRIESDGQPMHGSET